MTKDEYRDIRDKMLISYSHAAVNEEIVADLFSTILRNSDYLERFARDHGAAARTMRDTIHDIVVQIRRFLSGEQARSLSNAQIEAFRSVENQWYRAASLMDSALESLAEKNSERQIAGRANGASFDASTDLTDGAFKLESEAASQVSVKKNGGDTESTMRFSIKYDLDNTPYVVVENDILSGVPETEWVTVVKDNLHRKFPDGITVGENSIVINQSSRREMTFSNYMRRLFKTEPQMYADKLRATDNADEILKAARNWVNEALMHPRADAIIDFARGEVQLRIGSNDYTAQVIVGNRGKNGLVLYDIINLTPVTIPERTKKTSADRFITKAQRKPGDSQSAPAVDSITDIPEKSNSKFSAKVTAPDTDSATKSYSIDTWRDQQADHKKRYGTIKPGENPFREIEIEAKTAKNWNVMQTMRTVLESEATPDVLVPTIEKLITEGEFSAQTLPNKKAVEEAESRIKANGFATSYTQWAEDVLGAVGTESA